MSFKESVHDERKKFRELKGFKKKFQYLWDYYRYPFFGTIIAIAICISLGTTIYHNIKYEEIFCMAVINNFVRDEQRQATEQAFSEYYGLDPDSQTLSILGDFTIRGDGDGDFEATFASMQKLVAMMSAASIDTMLGDAAFMESYALDGTFYNLEELLPPDIFEELSEYCYYYKGEDGVERPYLLDLSSSIVKEQLGLYVEPPLIGVVVNSSHPDVAVQFLMYAFGLSKS